jgi:hypothetical protein
MDRRKTRKGLRKRMTTPQTAPSQVPQVAATPQHIGAVASGPGSDTIRKAPSRRSSSEPDIPFVLGDCSHTERENRFRLSRPGPIRRAEPDSIPAAPTTRKTGYSLARPTTTFFLHPRTPDRNTLNTNSRQVRVSDAQAKGKKRRQRLKPWRCCDCDLRFSFPHSGRFLRFLFQSARIGLGRSVKEDWMAH